MTIDREAEGVEHGGRLSRARRLFPGAPEPFLDLSTGINPVPYPVPPIPTEWFTRLPEPEALAALQGAAADAYGVADSAMVVAAPGAQILIELVPRLWPMRTVAVLGPTYGEYAPAWARAGADVHLALSPEELAEVDGAVLCNPNNPDGRRTDGAALLTLADRLATRGGLLVVDEAFADFAAEGVSVARALPHPALIVLRSFGKAYGLAGLRLGFALAEPQRAAAIRDALGPWAVSGPAIAIGCAALRDRRWRDLAARTLAAAAERLDLELVRAGQHVIGGTSLFRLAEAQDAAATFGRLGRAGILVRRFPDHPTWLRFGQPPDAAAWARLCAALDGLEGG